jgi:hypothetical protein
MVVSALAYTDFHRGSWIFPLVPRISLSRFAAGVVWTVWAIFIAAPIGLLTPWFAWNWGVVDALLFAAYTLAISSWLFGLQCLLIPGLPFASPPRSDRPVAMLQFILFGPIAVGIGFVLQSRFIFHSRIVTMAVAAAAALVAAATIKQTIAALDRRFDADLDRIAGR